MQRRLKRNNAVPSNFDDFVITENVSSERKQPTLSSEFIRRFSTQNILLWNAMSVLSPSSNNYLHFDTLERLLEYAEQIPVLREFYVTENLSAESFLVYSKTRNGPRTLPELSRMTTRKELQSSLPFTN